MCDERTEAENERWLLARRDVSMMAAGAAVAMIAPACASGTSPEAGAAETASRRVSIATSDGTADGFFVYPAKGKHPAILLWPDVASLRPAYETMATRLAGAGYAVLVVNQYYRSAPAPIFASFAEWRTEAGQAKLQPMRAALTPDAIMRDAGAFVDWLDGQSEVDTARKVGTTGYCMGGRFALCTAAARPERVGAAASFHGAGLVTDAPDSPHLLMQKMKAALLIAIAQNDDDAQPNAKDVLRAAAQAANLPAEIEVYPAQHGWCTIDAPVYDREQAEKAWSRMLATFGASL